LRLLLSVSADGGGAASSVTGGQDPVRRGSRRGRYQVTVSNGASLKFLAVPHRAFILIWRHAVK